MRSNFVSIIQSGSKLVLKVNWMSTIFLPIFLAVRMAPRQFTTFSGCETRLPVAKDKKKKNSNYSYAENPIAKHSHLVVGVVTTDSFFDSHDTAPQN